MICNDCKNLGHRCRGCADADRIVRNKKALDWARTGTVINSQGKEWYKDGNGIWRSVKDENRLVMSGADLARQGYDWGSLTPSPELIVADREEMDSLPVGTVIQFGQGRWEKIFLRKAGVTVWQMQNSPQNQVRRELSDYFAGLGYAYTIVSQPEEIPEMDEDKPGVWVTHGRNNTDIERVFQTEIEALRSAVAEGKNATFLPFGASLSEV